MWAPPTTAQRIAPNRVAIAPLRGDPRLAARIEDALLRQRPVQCSHVAVLTPAELQAASPVRLASAAPLQHDALSIAAAARAGADVVMQGEVVWADLPDSSDSGSLENEAVRASSASIAQRGRRWLGSSSRSGLSSVRAAVAWRLENVQDRRLLATQVVAYDVPRALEQYPDLMAYREAPSAVLAAAMARESWKMLGPWVRREKVRLAAPHWMPGGGRVWMGNRAARRGDWPTAERYWKSALDWFPWNAAAKHNLALAQVAREDWEGAQQTLDEIPAWLAFGLPRDTKYWVENKRRTYLQLAAPDTAASPLSPADQRVPASSLSDPLPSPEEVTPVDLTDPPWWPHFKPESPT